MELMMKTTIFYFCTILHSAGSDNVGDKMVLFNPESGSSFNTNILQRISYTIPPSTIDYMKGKSLSKFYLGIDYDIKDIYLTTVIAIAKIQGDQSSYLKWFHTKYHRAIYLDLNELNVSQSDNDTRTPGFNTYILHAGHTSFGLDLVELTSDNVTQVLYSNQYLVTAVREQRLVDTSFNIAITILAVLNTFALGCITDIEALKKAKDHKRNILLSAIHQYVLMPLVVFAFMKIIKVQNEVLLGLLFLTCVPGGGLGFLIVTITGNTDAELSIILNFLQIILPLGAVPLYVYSIGIHTPNGAGQVITTLYYLVFWMLALVFPYAGGILLRKFKPAVSDAFLNWLIKPLLLLAFILFITLGLYINMYMFGVLQTSSLAIGGLIPFLGFGIGGGLMLIFRQGKPAAKTLAIESAIMNCIIVIVAVRFTLPQPDADLASAAAMWVLFFTPVPFVLMFIFHRIKRKIMSHFEKKEFEKEQANTMLSSFAAITANAMQIGGLSGHDLQMQASSSQQSGNNASYGNGDKKRLIQLGTTNYPEDPSQVIVNNCSFMENAEDIEMEASEESSHNPLIMPNKL